MKPAATLAMLNLLALSPLAADRGVPEDEQDTASRAAKLFVANRYDDAANLYRVIILEHQVVSTPG